MNIDAELAWLEEEYSQARGNEREALLFAALVSCSERLPAWLFKALIERLASQRKLSADKERWAWARALLDQGDPPSQQQWQHRKSAGLLTEEQQTSDMTPLKWEEVWQRVSKILTFVGRPAKPETVRKSYALIEKSLPEAQRRPRTYRRRQLRQK